MNAQAPLAHAPSASKTGVSGWILYPLYILFLACLLTVCDYAAHVRLGVLWYANPEHFGFFPHQPTGDVWIGFLRIAAFCTALGWALFRRYPSPGLPKALAGTSIFVAVYFASGILKDSPMALYAGFMLAWTIHLLSFKHQTGKLVVFSVLLGVLGPILEGWASSRGFFAYYDQDAYHVPIWLSGLYFHGALAVAATLSVVESWRKK